MIKLKKLAYLGVGTSLFWTVHQAINKFDIEKRELLDAYKKNANKPILELSDFQRVVFPWEKNYNHISEVEDWEMRKVRIRGSLLGNFHLVFRERNGKNGYLVFQGLKTANASQAFYDPDDKDNKTTILGIMVNLGWIPADKVNLLKDTEINYITPVETDTTRYPAYAQVRNIHTGFVYNAEGEDLEYPIENMNEKEVIITGYLRKGEQPSFFMGRRFFKNSAINTCIDLDRMSAFYRLQNVWSSRNYYLEGAVEGDLAEVQAENLIIPTSLQNPKPILDEYSNNGIINNLKTIKKMGLISTGLLLFLF